MSLSPKKATTDPLPRMATGLGTTISPLPQEQLAMYRVQGKDEPLATKGNRVAYIVQGNDEPLATKSGWATTYADGEDAKGPALNLIAPMVIRHHCNEAP